MNSIYCIASSDGYIKIGVSVQPERRIADLQVGNPHKLTLAHVWPVTNPEHDSYVIENGIHGRLRGVRAEGEWFKASPECFYGHVEAILGAGLTARAALPNPQPPKIRVSSGKPRGRPRIHPDRKVYKADHERKRRAKAKS